MSRRDDYSDEMFTKRLSDEDVEALLSGGEPVDPSLAEVARALRALDPQRFEDPSEKKAAAFAQRATAVARAGEPAKLAATARYRRGLSLTPRLAPAAVAAILLLGMTGVAVASDAAAPGDPLYNVDRVLEEIGIGDGGPPERIAEAGVLAERGKSAEALEHLAESLDTTSAAAADSLHKASERIRELGPGNEIAADVRTGVAEMLDWMADNTDLSEQDFGQGVAELARGLGNENEGEAPGASEEAPDASEEDPAPPDETPGPPDDAGPPDTIPGPPEDTPGQDD